MLRMKSRILVAQVICHEIEYSLMGFYNEGEIGKHEPVQVRRGGTSSQAVVLISCVSLAQQCQSRPLSDAQQVPLVESAASKPDCPLVCAAVCVLTSVCVRLCV